MGEIADDRFNPPDVMCLVDCFPCPNPGFGVLLVVAHEGDNAVDQGFEVVALGDLPGVEPLVPLGRPPLGLPQPEGL